MPQWQPQQHLGGVGGVWVGVKGMRTTSTTAVLLPITTCDKPKPIRPAAGKEFWWHQSAPRQHFLFTFGKLVCWQLEHLMLWVLMGAMVISQQTITTSQHAITTSTDLAVVCDNTATLLPLMRSRLMPGLSCSISVRRMLRLVIMSAIFSPLRTGYNR